NSFSAAGRRDQPRRTRPSATAPDDTSTVWQPHALSRAIWPLQSAIRSRSSPRPSAVSSELPILMTQRRTPRSSVLCIVVRMSDRIALFGFALLRGLCLEKVHGVVEQGLQRLRLNAGHGIQLPVPLQFFVDMGADSRQIVVTQQIALVEHQPARAI